MMATLLASVFALQTEDLAAAAKKASEMESYTFKIEAKAGKGKHEAPSFEGRYQKDQPLALKSGPTEGFKKAGVVVAKEGEEFKRVEKRKKGDKGAKKDASPALAFFDVKLPHEDFEGLEKRFEKVEKAAEKENDCAVWSGALTPEAARGFGSSGSKGEAKANLTYSGTCKVWINGQGAIVKLEASVDVKGENKKGEISQHVTKTITLSEIGTTKVEVPEAAKKALEGQS
jgi:hypothetical protein